MVTFIVVFPFVRGGVGHNPGAVCTTAPGHFYFDHVLRAQLLEVTFDPSPEVLGKHERPAPSFRAREVGQTLIAWIERGSACARC